MPGLLQLRLQGLEHFRAHSQSFGEGVCADREDHELLKVDLVVGMSAAIDDVHQRHRQGPRAHAADVAIERQAGLGRRRLCDGQTRPENRVGAEPRLVERAVERDHGAVDLRLVFGIKTGQDVEDLAIHRLDRVQDPLAAVAFLVAVAQLDGFVRARRRAGRHGSAAERAALQPRVDLDSRIAAAVENFAGVKIDNGGHAPTPSRD